MAARVKYPGFMLLSPNVGISMMIVFQQLNNDNCLFKYTILCGKFICIGMMEFYEQWSKLLILGPISLIPEQLLVNTKHWTTCMYFQFCAYFLLIV